MENAGVKNRGRLGAVRFLFLSPQPPRAFFLSPHSSAYDREFCERERYCRKYLRILKIAKLHPGQGEGGRGREEEKVEGTFVFGRNGDVPPNRVWFLGCLVVPCGIFCIFICVVLSSNV